MNEMLLYMVFRSEAEHRTRKSEATRRAEAVREEARQAAGMPGARRFNPFRSRATRSSRG
jgi:hypothetical protein